MLRLEDFNRRKFKIYLLSYFRYRLEVVKIMMMKVGRIEDRVKRSRIV